MGPWENKVLSDQQETQEHQVYLAYQDHPDQQ